MSQLDLRMRKEFGSSGNTSNFAKAYQHNANRPDGTTAVNDFAGLAFSRITSRRPRRPLSPRPAGKGERSHPSLLF